jgi:hypothetical protein
VPTDTPILQKCPACGATIDTTEAEPLARVDCPKCGEKVRVERAFDNFALFETLGAGGMGSVYKARDTRLDRFVALKLLRKELSADPNHAAQLQQEARVMASINHPHVVQVFSSGSDHRQFYLVMEMVDHGSLDDSIEESKRVSEERVLETGIQVAQGLRAAHAKGLMHRDIKPANILFADEHNAKISDFGLAGGVAERQEEAGQIWGTPYYVAPERLNNQPEDFRSDIYSLGATLFHAIAGRPPIEGETNSAIELSKLKSQPFDLAQVAPDVSPETARIINRMIAPNPENRFASYDDLIADLQKAYAAVTGTDYVDLVKRSRKVAWITGAVALLLALIAMGAFVFARKQQERSATIIKTAGQVVPIAELERQLQEGRRQLLVGHHKVALTAFARIANDARNRQPLHDWARLHQGLAAIIARDSKQAHDAFQDVERSGENGFATEDVDLAKSLVGIGKTMNAPGAVPPSAAKDLHAETADVFALFLFGVKDVEQLDIASAISLLERFLAAQPAGKFAWINELKPLAQKYLDDCRLYATWKAQPPAQREQAIKSGSLSEMKKKLKARSAIFDALGAEEKSLTGRPSGQKAEDQAAKPAKKNADVAAFSKKKAAWLAAWKAKLINDINRSHFSGAIADVNGMQYQGISSATPEQLSLQTPYGIVSVSWAKVAPKTLLTVSTSFVKSNQADAADRQWLCAVFASETGEMESAQTLGEAAAEIKPEYRDQISLLTAPH